jgi:hypothetical protein
MLRDVRCYFRDNGKLVCIDVDYAIDHTEAIWQIRERVLLEEDWFEIKQPVMALVNK